MPIAVGRVERLLGGPWGRPCVLNVLLVDPNYQNIILSDQICDSGGPARDSEQRVAGAHPGEGVWGGVSGTL